MKFIHLFGALLLAALPAGAQTAGTLDAAYDPDVAGGFGNVIVTAVQPDWKTIIGGNFTTVGGAGHVNLARLNADGSVDASFTASTDSTVFCVVVQADGKILLGGSFSVVNGTTRNRIARLNADGSLESTATFDPGTGVDSGVPSVAVQADGKILLGGGFSTVNGTPRNNIARLSNDLATRSLTAPDATRAQWLRGGTSPEVSQVTFELSTDGGSTWSALGAGTRIAGGWQLTGQNLPASGSLRARGRTAGGIFSSTSGLVETVTGFPFNPADADGDGLLDAWEQTYWPTIAGHGPADDFDRDGLTELQELAFGLNPTKPDSALAPAPLAEGGYLTITLTKHPGAAYEVQSAGTVLGGQPASFSPATTTVLLDTATTLKVRDNILLGTPPARFLRVKVLAAP